MSFTPRVLDANPVPTLQAWIDAGGRAGADRASEIGGDAVLAEIEASGLRGRGGAGFPTGTKWRTVLENLPAGAAPTVVVNAAEGEPGTFKDRAILRANPYRVLEGALIAVRTMGSKRLVLAVKETFEQELTRLQAAIDEIRAAGWADGIDIEVVRGPSSYLFGEETAMLEVLAGGGPFPRVTPPYRTGGSDEHQPTLVDNVETLANVPGIVARGADWFREVGTDESPGSIVVTVSGRMRRHGVVEVPMGTPTSAALEAAGGQPLGTITAVLSGASSPPLPAAHLDAPLSHEGWRAAGASLGSASLIVLDESDDPVAVAAGISRFLAVESCGQCTPCKRDGLAIAGILDRLRRTEQTDGDVEELPDLIRTVSIEARCALAGQQEAVVTGMLETFPDAFQAHAERRTPEVEPYELGPIADLQGDVFLLDDAQRTKQPDWSHDAVDSGTWPAQAAGGGSNSDPGGPDPRVAR